MASVRVVTLVAPVAGLVLSTVSLVYVALPFKGRRGVLALAPPAPAADPGGAPSAALARIAHELVRVVTGSIGPFYDPHVLAGMNAARRGAAAASGLHTEPNRILLVVLDGLRYDYVESNPAFAALLRDRSIMEDAIVRVWGPVVASLGLTPLARLCRVRR